ALRGSRLGAAGVFYRAVSDRGRSGECGDCSKIAGAGGTLEFAKAGYVYGGGCTLQQYRQQCARGDVAEVVDPRIQQSAYGVVGSGHGFHSGGKPDHHRKRGQSYRGGEREAGDGDWFLGLFSGWFADYAGDSFCRMGMAGVDALAIRVGSFSLAVATFWDYGHN